MSLVIAIRGEPSKKIVDGELRSVVPFVGTDREGEFSQMGIGLLFPDEEKATIWGLLMPHTLIKSWRGMKLLEQVKHIKHSTLCSCYTIATDNVHKNDKRHFEELADQFGGMEKLKEFRAKVLASVPSAEEIDTMINTLREKGVGIDSWDLTAEVEAGRIETSPAIEQLVQEEARDVPNTPNRRSRSRNQFHLKKVSRSSSRTCVSATLSLAPLSEGMG